MALLLIDLEGKDTCPLVGLVRAGHPIAAKKNNNIVTHTSGARYMTSNMCECLSL